MAIKIDPHVKRPQTETAPRRSGGWWRALQRRVRLALSGSDDELVVENKTAISWRVYHDYHWLGTIDPGEVQTFKLEKRGTLNVRPSVDGDDIEYLVLPLDVRVHRVRIYQRRLGQDVEVYDMRAA
jgi:hypothetical protein